MAHSAARAASRIVPHSKRIEQRKRIGNVSSVHQAALAELDAGNLKNAWALLQEAIGHALREAWLKMPGHSGSTITDKQALLEKLRASLHLDPWTYRVVKTAIEHPHGYDYRRVDMLAGIVRAFVFDQPAAQAPTVMGIAHNSSNVA
jgi:hypothetical protein